MAKQPNNDAISAGLLTIADERKVVANLLTTYKKVEECAHPKLSRTDTFCCDLCLAAPMCDAMSAVIDARKLFGSLQLEARTRRFKTEVAAFERQCSDRARNFVDMFEAVAWARQHPASAMHFMLAMKDDAPDQVLVGRLARIYTAAAERNGESPGCRSAVSSARGACRAC